MWGWGVSAGDRFGGGQALWGRHRARVGLAAGGGVEEYIAAAVALEAAGSLVGWRELAGHFDREGQLAAADLCLKWAVGRAAAAADGGGGGEVGVDSVFHPSVQLAQCLYHMVGVANAKVRVRPDLMPCAAAW